MRVYRLTHIDNIPFILLNGITGKNSSKTNLDFVSIGDVSLISNRDEKFVYIDNGEISSESKKRIRLGDFTPFYFGVKMPMLYVIQNGGNFVPKAYSANKIIYLAIDLKDIANLEVELYFSDGHATDNYTSFYEREYLSQINDILDWTAIKSRYWGGEENLNLKRKKQAELLVYGDIPSELISVFACYDEYSKEQLVQMGVDSEKIKIVPKAYF